MNKLELLRSFIRVTELSSFTQAGESLGLPKSTVSEHIQALEALVGARLLHRTTRRVTATQDGQVLYERGKDMLANMDELEGLFRQDGLVLAGRLRVDMPAAFARAMVLPRLGDFMQKHPNVRIEISCTDRRVDIVREGFDCVLRIGELTEASLVARRLGWLPMVNCASPSYLAAHGVPRTPADLAGHVLVHYVSILGSRAEGFVYRHQGKALNQDLPSLVTVNNVDAYEAACLGGLGIIQAPAVGMGGHLAAGRLVEILPDYPAPPMDVSLVYAHRRYLPQRARVFMDWLAELLAPAISAHRP
ncbi:LysR substrate-binding domain-containing protein [Acerihabitans arboris]|uniref:LysR family transcriptional regulator n=1 Tax=Acerihabitans arboris TaxID=2691583 RepID=A0A845SR77_9GAMM|nr:LysR family transcriptional regulator [Acerihabitans arboris]NDL65128.1 LysR family transcriptional regulator [Acerihabitans arboris]